MHFVYVFCIGLSEKSSEKILSGRTRMIEFGIHKELSESYREGTTQKLKSMALPYKTKVRKKMTNVLTFGFLFHKDLSKSNREGIDPKLQTMAFPYKIKG